MPKHSQSGPLETLIVALNERADQFDRPDFDERRGLKEAASDIAEYWNWMANNLISQGAQGAELNTFAADLDWWLDERVFSAGASSVRGETESEGEYSSRLIHITKFRERTTDLIQRAQAFDNRQQATAMEWSRPMAVKEIAMMLHKHRNTVRAWLRKGTIRAEQVSANTWRVDKRELPA